MEHRSTGGNKTFLWFTVHWGAHNESYSILHDAVHLIYIQIELVVDISSYFDLFNLDQSNDKYLDWSILPVTKI